MAVIATNLSVTSVNVWVQVTDPATAGGNTVNINVVNKNTVETQANVDICITAGSPADSDYIEEFTPVNRAAGPLLRTGEPIKEGEMIFIRTTAAGLSVRVSGFNRL